MTDQQRAYAYALTAVLFWSTVASAFKLSLNYLDPFQLLLYSTLTSVLTLFLLLVVQGKLALLRFLTRREIFHGLALGLLNPFLYYVVLFKAYELLPAQEAQPLNYTWAIALALLSIPLLKQRLRLVELLAIGVSYSGVVVISTHGDPLSLEFSNAWGVGLALASTVVWALFWILNTRRKGDPVVGLFLNFLGGLPCVLVATLAFSSVWVNDLRGLAGAAYVGVFEMGITFVLWLQALRLSSSTARVGTLIFFSPFLSLVLIHFLVGEQIRASTIVGLGLIVVGSAWQQWASRKRPPPGERA